MTWTTDIYPTTGKLSLSHSGEKPNDEIILLLDFQNGNLGGGWASFTHWSFRREEWGRIFAAMRTAYFSRPCDQFPRDELAQRLEAVVSYFESWAPSIQPQWPDRRKPLDFLKGIELQAGEHGSSWGMSLHLNPWLCLKFMEAARDIWDEPTPDSGPIGNEAEERE